MPEIPAEYHDLFETDTLAHLTTMNPDGTPHATPVWVGYDAEANRLLVNTERGRRKERNAAKDPSVAMSMADPENPYRYLSVTGEVEEITAEGAREHIDELAQRYIGSDYGTPIQTERVILRIRPEEVLTEAGA
jgi:PPOX class probable F420-dependent enzyme